jgi:hypothetical protein
MVSQPCSLRSKVKFVVHNPHTHELLPSPSLHHSPPLRGIHNMIAKLMLANIFCTESKGGSPEGEREMGAQIISSKIRSLQNAKTRRRLYWGRRVAVTWLKPFPEPPSIFCLGHGFFLCLLHGLFFISYLSHGLFLCLWPGSWPLPLYATWVRATFPLCYLGHDLLPRMLPEPCFFSCLLPES